MQAPATIPRAPQPRKRRGGWIEAEARSAPARFEVEARSAPTTSGAEARSAPSASAVLAALVPSPAPAAGGEVVSLGLPMTWPAPLVPGLIVGGFDAPTAKAAFSSCPEFAAHLHSRDLTLDLSTIWRHAPRAFDELYTGVARMQAVFRDQAAAAVEAYPALVFDAMAKDLGPSRFEASAVDRQRRAR